MSTNQPRAGLTAAGAGILSAFGASICCLGPIAAATLGLGSVGALTRFESLRPWLAGLTVLFLGIAFFLTYRPAGSTECAPGSVCEVKGAARVGRLNRVVLWSVAAIAILVLTFPTWVNWFF